MKRNFRNKNCLSNTQMELEDAKFELQDKLIRQRDGEEGLEEYIRILTLRVEERGEAVQAAEEFCLDFDPE